MRRGPVLLLEDDPAARAALLASLAGTGHAAIVPKSADEALERLSSDRTVRLVLVSGERGLAFCKRVRTLTSGPYRHIFALASRGRRQEILDALEAGADQVLATPLSPDVLARHLAAAERAHRPRAQRASVRVALQDAANHGDGELVIRAGTTVARVFFHHGDVAWLAVPGQPSALEAVLDGPIQECWAEAQAVLDESRRTGRPFDEVIVSLGLASPDWVVSSLREWFRRGVAALLALPEPEVLFLPGKRAFGGHRVSLASLLEGSEPPPSTRKPLSLPPPAVTRKLPKCDGTRCQGCGDDVTRTIRGLLDLDAVLGAAVVHAATGQAIGAGGVTIDPDVLAAQVRTIRTLPSDEQLGELVLTGASTLHISHATACEGAVVSVLAARSVAPLALLRISVARVAKSIAPIAP
jgi:CheY-like chemotaxis protein